MSSPTYSLQHFKHSNYDEYSKLREVLLTFLIFSKVISGKIIGITWVVNLSRFSLLLFSLEYFSDTNYLGME